MKDGISNAEIKRIKSLALKKFRDQEGLFTVEGEKMVSEALESSFHVEKIYRTEEIGHEAMARISALSSPSPVLATVRKPEDLILESRAQLLASLIRPHAVKPAGLFLALDTIRDPGNLGTILRIADWFGADAVFECKPVNKQGEKRLDHRPAGAQKRAFVHFFQIGLSQQVNLPPVVTVFPKDRKQARFGPAAGFRALRNSGQQKHNLPSWFENRKKTA